MNKTLSTLIGASALLAGAALIFDWQAPASAFSVTYTGSGSTGYNGITSNATATFDTITNPGKLTITLTHLDSTVASGKQFEAGNTIGALFFRVNNSSSLTLTSLRLPTGSKLINPANGTTVTRTSLNSLWGYNNSVTNYSANFGISAVGYDVFGKSIDNTNLQGSNGSVLPSGYLNTCNASCKSPEILNSVQFVVSAYSGNLSDISNVTFQYGTSLDEGHITGVSGGITGGTVPAPVPEPLTLLGSGICLGFGAFMKRKLGKEKMQG